MLCKPPILGGEIETNSQNISSSALVPPSPVLMFVAHSKHALFENGKSLVSFLHTGLLHSEQFMVAVLVLQM